MILPKSNIADFIKELAKEYGVKYIENDLDRFAKAVVNLSGDEVKSDETRELLVRLAQSKIINSKQMLTLLARHLSEIKKSNF